MFEKVSGDATVGKVSKRLSKHRSKGDDGLLSSQILIGMSVDSTMLFEVANYCWPTNLNGLVGLDMSLELGMGSGVVLLHLNRVGFGALDALSDCGVALLEWQVAEGDSMDLDFLLGYHCDWQLIPFSSDSNLWRCFFKTVTSSFSSLHFFVISHVLAHYYSFFLETDLIT